MIMNPKYLQYCKYYKGEESIPWDRSFDRFTRFWILERDYYSCIYEDNHEYWETIGPSLIDQPQVKKFVSRIKDKTIRGFVCCSVVLTKEHNPSAGESFILKYKYDD